MKLTQLVAAALLAAHASAHGFLAWPISRIQPHDQQNGYTYARAAANRNTDVHADPDMNCSFLPKGPVFTQVMAPGPATVDYTITAFHKGGCIAYLSQDNQKTWQQIGQDPTCGVQTINTTGRGSINVTIPDGTYQGVIRWTYTADNGGSPNEIFTNCADVLVAPSGTNKHLQVELMSGPSSPWTVVLPKTPWQFQSSSCPVAGSTLCAGPGSSFINQCVTLPAGGGWVGGSSYYQYQCPWGSTCQTVNGIDACVGGVVVPSTTAVTTAATTKSTTVPPSVTAPTKSTTTTTTTTTSRPPTTTTTTTTTLRPTSTTTTTTTVPVTKSTTTTIKPTTSTTTTTTTTTKATATSSVIGVACYPAWSSTAVYPTAGTGKVSYQNGNYVNKWWTQNEVPDSTKPNGAWTYQGPCGGSTQPSTTTTTAAQTTAGGSTVTKTVSTATASSTSVVIIPGTPCPVLADNSLRLPYPVGQTCVDVKHACQDFCTSHQWYTIQRNQCFSEDTTNNTAIQWCQCNDVTYYGVAFGKPTTACPV